jgi:hypothetical protein
LITFIKWVIGKAVDNWIGILAGAFLGAVGITSVVATAWIKHLIELSMCAVAVPRYVFGPWLILTVVGVGFYLWAFFRGPPATAQNFYARDIVEGFQWRWDVAANPSNASPYGKVFNLTRYCCRCQSVSFKIDFQGPTQALVTCDNANCRLVTSVTDFNRQEDRVKLEVERRAATNEWKGDKRRIRRAAKAK